MHRLGSHKLLHAAPAVLLNIFPPPAALLNIYEKMARWHGAHDRVIVSSDGSAITAICPRALRPAAESARNLQLKSESES